MATVTADLSISVDGFAAGPEQSLDRPFGTGAARQVTRWMMEAPEQSRAELDGIVGADVFVMGRNMFGPDRGPFDLDWMGWWGDEPPYAAPVLVLTHHERAPLVLGATTFTFVTGGIHEAHRLAEGIAGDDGRIAIAGGATTVDQFLAAGLVDELRLHVAPVVVGEGVRLFANAPDVRLEQRSARQAELVTHLTYAVLRD